MLSSYQYASNSPIWCIDLDGLEAVIYTYGSTIQAGEEGPHAMVAIWDDIEGLTVYTYGRYINGEGNAFGKSPGVLIKLTGQEAVKEIAHAMNHSDAKATYIDKVDKTKIKEYYENKLNKGTELTNDQKTDGYKENKNTKRRIINKYNVLNGNICSGEVLRAFKYAGFNLKKKLAKGDYNKNMKIKGFIKVQYSVQILQARLDAEVEEENDDMDKNKAQGDTRECIPLDGVKDVTSAEKKSPGSSLKPAKEKKKKK
jgi:hypothetical protein